MIADAAVLTRVLTALAAEAQRHSPADRPARLTAQVRPGFLEIRVTDGNGEAAEGAAPGPDRGHSPESLALRLIPRTGGGDGRHP